MASPSRAKIRGVPVPTRRLVLALVPAAVLALISLLVPGLAVLWESYFLLLVALVGLEFLVPVRIEDIEVRRRLPRAFVVGRFGEYELVIGNRGRQAVDLAVREVLPPEIEAEDAAGRVALPAGEEGVSTRKILPLERGLFTAPPVTVRVSRPLGLVARQAAVGESDRLLVLPGRPENEVGVLLKRVAVIEAMGARPSKRRGEDWEFDSLRDYVVGDDIRFMDWKATARRSKATVRQFRLERDAQVVLALDTGRLMGSLVRGVRKLDLAMTPVLDLTATALRRGDRVGLVAFDSRIRGALPARSGLQHLNLMRQTLAGLDVAFDQTLFLRLIQHLESRHRKRSLVVVFTDFTDELSSLDMIAALTPLALRHVLLFVAVGDPHVDEIQDQPPTSARDVFQKAVAADLVSERARVLRRLSRHGALVVDADPANLTAPLLNRYLEGVRTI